MQRAPRKHPPARDRQLHVQFLARLARSVAIETHKYARIGSRALQVASLYAQLIAAAQLLGSFQMLDSSAGFGQLPWENGVRVVVLAGQLTA